MNTRPTKTPGMESSGGESVIISVKLRLTSALIRIRKISNVTCLRRENEDIGNITVK